MRGFEKQKGKVMKNTAVYCIWFFKSFWHKCSENTCQQLEMRVVAVDTDADRVAQIADDVSYAVQVDVADEECHERSWNGAYGWLQSLLLLATWKQAL